MEPEGMFNRNLEGIHGKYDFKIENEDNHKRLAIYSTSWTDQQDIVSIAVKSYQSGNNGVGLWDKFKMKILTALSWKWVKADNHTLININSLARHTGLTKHEIKASAKANTLADTVADKLEETAKIERNEKIALFKEHPVINSQAKDIINSAVGIKIRDVDTYPVMLYWHEGRGELLASGPGRAKPYMNREEISNNWFVTAQVYFEDDQMYIQLDKNEVEHIDAREFRNDTLATYLTPNITDDQKEEAVKNIYNFLENGS